MTVRLDDSGRLPIPAALRERLGLRPGASVELTLSDAGDGGPALELRPAPAEPLLAERNGRLVYVGPLETPDLDLVDLLRAQREARAGSVSGRERV